MKITKWLSVIVGSVLCWLVLRIPEGTMITAACDANPPGARFNIGSALSPFSTPNSRVSGDIKFSVTGSKNVYEIYVKGGEAVFALVGDREERGSLEQLLAKYREQIPTSGRFGVISPKHLRTQSCSVDFENGIVVRSTIHTG
jgi:hypothetical protein